MRVARATGQPVLSIARQPYALTLWTHGRLAEIEHFESIRLLGARIDEASLAAVAFYEPKKLAKAYHRYEQLAGLLPSVSDTKRKGLDLLNADRVTRGLPPLTEI